jgi:hypothetical protein
MQNPRFLTRLFIICALAAVLVVFPSCRRAPEEPTATTTTPASEDELTGLELPQLNPKIGISLNAAPAGLVVTYNGEHWIELTDQNRHSLRYTFIESVPQSPGIAPTGIQDFEVLISEYPDGEVLGHGSVKTSLGMADWSNGTYSEDGEALDEVMMYCVHPSGSGILILRSICPAGLTTIDERLSVMQKLLTHVS